MGPLITSILGGVAGSIAGELFKPKQQTNLPGQVPGQATPTPTKGNQLSIYDDAVGADDIYIDTGGESDDEVGAAKARPRATTAKGRAAFRRIAFLPATSIPSGSASVLPVVVNAPFKGIGIRLAGANTDLLFFGGAVIRGRPQEGSSGSVGGAIFRSGETFFWEWDTANPGENFTLNFSNSATVAATPTGFLIGYLAP